MSYDDFIKKSAAQQLIMEAIVKDQKFSMREYDYKGDLDEFAGDNGYSDENAFVEKFGKDSVVKAMLVQKAQDYVIEMPILRISKARKNLGCVWEPAAYYCASPHGGCT